MYCPKCGSEVADGAKFCPSCGMPIATAPQPPQSPQAPQPPQPTQAPSGTYGAPQPPYSAPQPSVPPVANPQYRTMGGWFLFFLICYVIDAIYYVINGFQSFGYANQLGYLASLVGMGWVPTILYIVAVVMILCGVLIFYFCYLAFSKQPGFLKIYQTTCIILIVTQVVLAIVYGTMQLPSAELWGGAVGSVIGMLLMTYYYCKSVRVQTYMGTNDYKRQAIFTLGN